MTKSITEETQAPDDGDDDDVLVLHSRVLHSLFPLHQGSIDGIKITRTTIYHKWNAVCLILYMYFISGH